MMDGTWPTYGMSNENHKIKVDRTISYVCPVLPQSGDSHFSTKMYMKNRAGRMFWKHMFIRFQGRLFWKLMGFQGFTQNIDDSSKFSSQRYGISFYFHGFRWFHIVGQVLFRQGIFQSHDLGRKLLNFTFLGRQTTRTWRDTIGCGHLAGRCRAAASFWKLFKARRADFAVAIMILSQLQVLRGNKIQGPYISSLRSITN